MSSVASCANLEAVSNIPYDYVSFLRLPSQYGTLHAALVAATHLLYFVDRWVFMCRCAAGKVCRRGCAGRFGNLEMRICHFNLGSATCANMQNVFSKRNSILDLTDSEKHSSGSISTEYGDNITMCDIAC